MVCWNDKQLQLVTEGPVSIGPINRNYPEHILYEIGSQINSKSPQTSADYLQNNKRNRCKVRLETHLSMGEPR